MVQYIVHCRVHCIARFMVYSIVHSVVHYMVHYVVQYKSGACDFLRRSCCRPSPASSSGVRYGCRPPQKEAQRAPGVAEVGGRASSRKREPGQGQGWG